MFKRSDLKSIIPGVEQIIIVIKNILVVVWKFRKWKIAYFDFWNVWVQCLVKVKGPYWVIQTDDTILFIPLPVHARLQVDKNWEKNWLTYATKMSPQLQDKTKLVWPHNWVAPTTPPHKL